MDFFDRVNRVVDLFKPLSSEVITIVGNIDTDGITATSILAYAFSNEKIPFILTPTSQITDAFLHELVATSHNTILFIDLGSNLISTIETILKDKTVFIIDHHYPEKTNTTSNVVLLNPHLDGIDGTRDISAAGVTYFFAKALTDKTITVAHLAVIGAIGDVQDVDGMTGLNELILDDAIKTDKLDVTEGLLVYGAYTKPLYEVLEQSTNPYIPNVTGNESAAIKFLTSLGIPPRDERGYRALNQLTPDETKKLIDTLVTLTKAADAKRFYGLIYLLEGQPLNSPTRDLREFSTLLNCCGRMGKPGLGVAVCLGDKQAIKEATLLMIDYRREVVEAIRWFHKQRTKQTKSVIEGKGYAIINAEGYIRDTIIGTLTSLISKSNVYPDDTILLSAAHTLGDSTKVSLRISGHHKGNINLRDLLQTIISKSGGHGGGHSLAAGAIIPQDKEDAFFSAAIDIMNKLAPEQGILPAENAPLP